MSLELARDAIDRALNHLRDAADALEQHAAELAAPAPVETSSSSTPDTVTSTTLAGDADQGAADTSASVPAFGQHDPAPAPVPVVAADEVPVVEAPASTEGL